MYGCGTPGSANGSGDRQSGGNVTGHVIAPSGWATGGCGAYQSLSAKGRWSRNWGTGCDGNGHDDKKMKICILPLHLVIIVFRNCNSDIPGSEVLTRELGIVASYG